MIVTNENITSKQRSKLKSIAANLSPVTQIGKSGITDSVIKQLDESLEAHEMIKITVLETAFMSGKECAGILAEELNADVVQVIGFKIVLYRPASKEEKRKIEIPF